jgi:dTDP-4-dehydrorhamnose 3,5-epimerase
MRHQHLTHQEYTLAAIDDVIARGKRQVWIPKGFAHGFLFLSDWAEFLCKTTDYYAPEHECSILWSDPDLGIEWPLENEPILAAKDKTGSRLREAELLE